MLFSCLLKIASVKKQNSINSMVQNRKSRTGYGSDCCETRNSMKSEINSYISNLFAAVISFVFQTFHTLALIFIYVWNGNILNSNRRERKKKLSRNTRSQIPWLNATAVYSHFESFFLLHSFFTLSLFFFLSLSCSQVGHVVWWTAMFYISPSVSVWSRIQFTLLSFRSL